MSRFLVPLFLIIFVFLPPLFAEKVRYVIDGDTFVLENNQRVRMIGIDTPEISNRKYKRTGEYFGQKARSHLAGLIKGKEVTLKDGKEPFDRFGRRLSYVYLPDGTFVNRKMVNDGYAEVMRKFPFEHQNEFKKLEEKAREAKIGMWADQPSDWTDRIQAWLSELAGR